MVRAAAAPPASPAPSEIIPWEAICARHPDEWVILVDMVHRDHRVVAGRVHAHSADKRALREPGREAMALYGAIGGFFTGTLRRAQYRVDDQPGI